MEKRKVFYFREIEGRIQIDRDNGTGYGKYID